jgi:predicted ATPase
MQTESSISANPANHPFIRHISIQHFLGQQSLEWQLQKTNVLVGANGSGKSTLLRILRELLIQPTSSQSQKCVDRTATIDITFDDDTHIRWQSQCPLPDNLETVRDKLHVVYLATFDSHFSSSKHNHNTHQHTQLDVLLHDEINQFKSYQLRLNHQLRQQCRDASALADFITLEQHIFSPLRRFENLCKHFFASSGKRFESLDDGGIAFDQHGVKIQPWQLSSGEKQLLLLLLKALNHSEQPTIFLLDEPEISLHLAWQEKLLDAIHQINPDSQIIIVTHSPAIVMDGWIDSEVDIDSLIHRTVNTVQLSE